MDRDNFARLVISSAFTPDSEFALTGGRDRIIKVREEPSCVCLPVCICVCICVCVCACLCLSVSVCACLSVPARLCFHLRMSDAPKLMVRFRLCQTNRQVWNAETGECVSKATFEGGVDKLSASPNGFYIAGTQGIALLYTHVSARIPSPSSPPPTTSSLVLCKPFVMMAYLSLVIGIVAHRRIRRHLPPQARGCEDGGTDHWTTPAVRC